MSSGTSRATDPSLKGVGGWLAFFCFILLVVFPLMALVLWGQTGAKIEYLRTRETAPVKFSDPALNQLSDQLFDPAPAKLFEAVAGPACTIAIVVAVFGVIVGIMLMARTKGAVLTAKVYLLCIPLASLSQFFFVSAALPENLKNVMTSGMLQDVLKSTLYGAIWFAYFCRSRRVKNTYGMVGA